MKHYFNYINFLFFILLCDACVPTENNKPIQKTIVKQTVIETVYVIPLGDVRPKVLSTIVKGIEQFYGLEVSIEKSVPLTDDLLAISKTRYEASKILRKFKSNKNQLVITERDIATKNEAHKTNEWGVIGLGYRPGKTCVVSTFRIGRNVNRKLFNERLAKICVHEIGHNLGLPHCTNDIKCLMHAANGSIRQVDREEMAFCKKCKGKLL